MTAVLDSWAVLAYLDDQAPAAEAVGELLSAERPLISWINLGEVFYVVRRAHGEHAAASTIRDVRTLVEAEAPSHRRVIEAARIKSDHAMAYADAFVAATAIAHEAAVWTGDPELMVNGAGWDWIDLRG